MIHCPYPSHVKVYPIDVKIKIDWSGCRVPRYHVSQHFGAEQSIAWLHCTNIAQLQRRHSQCSGIILSVLALTIKLHRNWFHVDLCPAFISPNRSIKGNFKYLCVNFSIGDMQWLLTILWKYNVNNFWITNKISTLKFLLNPQGGSPRGEMWPTWVSTTQAVTQHTWDPYHSQTPYICEANILPNSEEQTQNKYCQV